MNILVLNGSPKGKYSITLQTVLYLEKLHPDHTFEILNVGQTIKSLEKDFSSAIDAVQKADLLLFSYPVYTFIAPSQLHRFIELLKAADLDLSRKFATQISTSKHFYDVTAHRYIQDNCLDLGLKYIKGLSADMDDLLSKKGQKEAVDFFNFVCWSVTHDSYEPFPAPLGAPAHIPVTVPDENPADKSGDVVIVTDCEADNTQLSNMIARFQSKLPIRSRIVNIRDYPFKGGCLGCFNCAISGKCIYKDNFDDYLRNTIQSAQSIVYAFTVKDHSMGALFKMYDDRQFCNGHRTVTIGMPMGYLISGDYSKEFNLQMIVEARAQVGGNFLAGVATDEFDPDSQIDRLAAQLSYALAKNYVQPQNFFGVGGMKVFRDLIWLMQGMMKADHKFYKAHGQYDFPQKQWPTMLKMYLVGALLSSPKLKSKMGNAMNDGMIGPYKKVLDKLNKQ
jgi:multimeric flavodoxin WrbA